MHLLLSHKLIFQDAQSENGGENRGNNMLTSWVGIFIGIALILIGYAMSLLYLPNKSANPQVTLSHLRYFYLESLALILGGLLLVVISLLLTIV